MTASERNGLELRSTLTPDGVMQVRLVEVAVPAPRAGEVMVRIEAAAVNPSDLLLLVGPVETAALIPGIEDGRPVLTAHVPSSLLPIMQARVGTTLTAGLEGAGTVVAAGADVKHYLGRRVALGGGGMFAQYRTVPIGECALLPDDVTAAQAASNWTNPMTALAMMETIRPQRAAVLTAAASNLGQMLNRVAQADGVEVVNIVRSAAQVKLLQGIGARYVLDSTSDRFPAELAEACTATGACVAFDFIGGGTMAGEILQAMEAGLRRQPGVHPLYGSPVYKHVYICGALDRSRIELDRRPFGQAWGVSGFYVGNALAQLGEEVTSALRARVIRELKTTFASHYAATIGMHDLLDPNLFDQAMRKTTGGKFLLDPSR